MYQGDDIGTCQKLVETCLEIFKAGKKPELYEVLPYIGVVRSPSFLQPLLDLLESGNQDQIEFAAVALGSLGDPTAIAPLHQVFMTPSVLKGSEHDSLQAAIISALGEIGDEQAMEPLSKIYELGPGNSDSRRRRWVLSAIGQLAQQGSMLGVKELTRLMRSKESAVCAQAVAELAVAYWHRPNELPDTVLQEMASLIQDTRSEVGKAALSTLSDLADLGCRTAEQHLQRSD